MRRRIIEALTYPRIRLLANLGEEQCLQNHYFNPAHKACRRCDKAEECLWLNSNDEFSVLARKPMERLYRSLLFCIDYISAENSYARHNAKHCACESCRWVREARRLGQEYESAIKAQ